MTGLTRMRNVTIIAMLLALGGCGPEAATPDTAKPATPDAVMAVDEIFTNVSMAAVNFDAQPDPDGFQASAWFFASGRNEPVLVRGRVELLMFEGVVKGNDLLTALPRHVWEFPGDQLPRYAGKHRLMGWGYNFGPLLWGSDVPRQGVITVVFRYTGGNKVIYSNPTPIIVREQK